MGKFIRCKKPTMPPQNSYVETPLTLWCKHLGIWPWSVIRSWGLSPPEWEQCPHRKRPESLAGPLLPCKGWPLSVPHEGSEPQNPSSTPLPCFCFVRAARANQDMSIIFPIKLNNACYRIEYRYRNKNKPLKLSLYLVFNHLKVKTQNNNRNKMADLSSTILWPSNVQKYFMWCSLWT